LCPRQGSNPGQYCSASDNIVCLLFLFKTIVERTSIFSTASDDFISLIYCRWMSNIYLYNSGKSIQEQYILKTQNYEPINDCTLWISIIHFDNNTLQLIFWSRLGLQIFKFSSFPKSFVVSQENNFFFQNFHYHVQKTVFVPWSNEREWLKNLMMLNIPDFLTT
jgi:hypothetical protein